MRQRAGLFAQFKSDGPPGFLLPNRCSICRVPAGGDMALPCASQTRWHSGTGWHRLTRPQVKPHHLDACQNHLC
jgi:hypothetical protein